MMTDDDDDDDNDNGLLVKASVWISVFKKETQRLRYN